MKSSPVGFYAWGGPGTIRLLQTKYFSPRIDRESFLTMYDRPFLLQAKEIFGVTDMWVTHSWGFSDTTEKEDYDFIAKRLENFSSLGIQTHAYIQGFNVVTDEFKEKDLFCHGPKGRLLPYSKGRTFTCPNNPLAISLIRSRIEKALQLPFDGIYVDNMLFGLPPIYLFQDRTSFFGCSCHYCQKAFQAAYGYTLPVGKKMGERVIGDYLAFRRYTLKKAIEQFAQPVLAGGKQFGINLYDPWWHTPEYFFGYHLSDIDPFLSYYLVENHALSRRSIHNEHLQPVLSNPKKNTFVVSYHKGIGRDEAYRQRDFDRIYSESQKMGYSPCYKATEYKTKGIWHGIKMEKYRPPRLVSFKKRKKPYPSLSLTVSSDWMVRFLWIADTFSLWLSSHLYKHHSLAKVFIDSPVYTRMMKKRRVYKL